MAKLTVKLSLTKSTPGTHVYTCAAGERATVPVSSVYVAKSAFKGEPPKEVTLTVEFDGE